MLFVVVLRAVVRVSNGENKSVINAGARAYEQLCFEYLEAQPYLLFVFRICFHTCVRLTFRCAAAAAIAEEEVFVPIYFFSRVSISD